MSSREEFMRQMGLTSDDLVKPPPENGAPEKPRRTRVDFHEGVGADRVAVTPKSCAPPVAATPAESAKSQSREAFLRSLGIDNYEPQGSAAAPTRNATGSQEYPRPERQQRATPARNAYGRASRVHEEDDDAYTNTYAPRMHESSPADITLGRKPSMHKAPETPGLDAELKAMGDAAGAEEVKALGNKYFQAGEYRKAVRLYTRAIELDGTNAALYSNRSAAYLLGSKQMGIDTRSMALRDADKAIKLKPTWFKGHSRRGDALFKLERYEDAAEAYEAALEIDPNNAGIVNSLNEVRPFMAKKKVDPHASGSWSAPGAGILHSSVTSQSATRAPSKSAYEMLDEFQAQRERDTPQLGRGGSDYKAAQLEKFRQRHSGSSDTFESESFTTSRMTASTAASPATPAPAEKVNVRNLPSEFNSDAARDYQNSLLEEYRRKKAAAAAGRR